MAGSPREAGFIPEIFDGGWPDEICCECLHGPDELEGYPMNCPYCNRPMVSGFVQARGEVYFTQSPHKLLFAAKGNDVVLTKKNNTSPTAVAWHCENCKRVIVEYGDQL